IRVISLSATESLGKPLNPYSTVKITIRRTLDTFIFVTDYGKVVVMDVVSVLGNANSDRMPAFSGNVLLKRVVVGQIYCLKEYKISPNHTGCKNANNITTVPAYGLQSFYNDVLLQLFNSYRSSVAVGNCKPFPSATNMLKLEWDNELATLAYLHSAFLINASNWPLHDEVENRFTTRFKETGQSVAVLHNTTHRYVSYWNTVIREWFAEYQLLKLAAVGSYDADESTTNVSQMWWATTKYVGCGYSTMLMPNGHDFDHAYVCNFGPAGNVRGHAIYRQGATCSACPKETRCEPMTGLCSVVDEPPFPPFNEGEIVQQQPPVGAADALAPAVTLMAVTAALRVVSYATNMR
ncbi:hypothetical protein MTO96_039504, partial [Rhipicephalus appendiculatus]